MKSREKLVLELKRLNEKLDHINNNSHFMVYNANPAKFAWFNFIAGFFHSLGIFVGYALLVLASIYVLSRINFVDIVTNLINQILPKIEIQKLIPAPKISNPLDDFLNPSSRL